LRKETYGATASGNFTVALLTGLSIELVNVFFQVNNHLVTIYAIFAFFMTLVREIIKDMEDLKGDHTFGCKTLPIVWGLRKTKVLLYFLLAILYAIRMRMWGTVPFLFLFFFGFGYMGIMSLVQSASGGRLASLWKPEAGTSAGQ